MARKEVQELYYWELPWESLNVYVVSSRKGARKIGLTLGEKKHALGYLRGTFPSAKLVEDEVMNAPLIRAVEAAMMNRSGPKGLGLDITGTPFQWKVWETMAKIPFGKTMTYGQIAEMIGSPGGGRAVGQAAGRNPLPIIFP
ncbi:MAG: methylated-DNA--[protein]-cysteine S-methyltransferase [Deltaproteobacteria bacterium]|nr:methylated-DNA--[protein]-cysteine S-methyltransferase [Deltaproteobacteria bacterium]MBW2137945.1 methylated-DNA--[protein]-cysteine S-methyltransferase [Deltaproteobacteria bacterium]